MNHTNTEFRTLGIGTLLGLSLSSVVPLHEARAARFSAMFDEPNGTYWLMAGGGLTFQNASRVATDAGGGASLLGNSYFSLLLSGRYSLGGSWGISPVFTFVPIGSKSADPGEKSRLITLDMRLYYDIDPVDLHFGPGVLFHTVSGSGGTTMLSNGTGTTEFGLPSGSSTSRFFYLEGGIGLRYSRFRVDLDVLITGALSARRAIYPMLTASVGIF